MQFNTGFTAFLALMVAAGTALAAPQMVRGDVVARAADADGHIFICTDAQFSGSCDNYGFFDNECSGLPSGFQDDISSAGPDKGWICTLYVDVGCPSGGSAYSVAYPGVSDFYNTGFNDAFSSLKCTKN